MPILGRVGAELSGSVSSYDGFREETAAPVVRREGPGRDVVLIVSFGEEWSIDGERLTSFAAGLRDRQVATRHEGRSHGIHVNVSPPAAHRLLGLPLHLLAYRQVPLEDVLDEPFLAERLYEAGGWEPVADRPKSAPKLLGLLPLEHSVGLALVYGAALAGWSYLVAWGVLAAADAGHPRQIGVAIGAGAGLLVLQQVLLLDGRR